MSIRVLICNHIHLYTEGLRRILDEGQGILVVGLASDDRDYEGLEDLHPDVVIADIACFSKLAGRAKKILLIWAGNGRHPFPPFGDLKTMVGQGLAGILDARTDSALLRKAVAKVHAGELWVDHQFIYSSLRSDGARTKVPLSRRETEILRHICEGDANKEIAVKLCISEQTVKTHCNHLYKKFGVSNRLQLALSVSSGE
jgi:DNA-binding NarL/FixJ family response regulator